MCKPTLYILFRLLKNRLLDENNNNQLLNNH